jgi:hypothetical protein
MRELVPELHDVLKLIKLRFSRDPHDIHEWDSRDYEAFEHLLAINTETWKGVRQHHLGFTEYPTEPDTFYLCVADSLASHVSRLGEAGHIERKLNKLWKPAEEERDVRLEGDEDISALFKFLQTDPSWAEFLQRYENLLKSRPEDFHHGKNITSLYTHSKLTGQFYRILRNNPHLFPLLPNEIEGKTKDEVGDLYRKKWNSEWKLTLARCKLHLLQRPFRAKDLNIFGALEDLTEEISTGYRDNLILRTSDELLLVLPDEAQLSDISMMAHQKGFWVEVIRARRALNGLKPPNPETMPGKKHENLYNLPKEISPPICEICQSAKATKRWPEDDILSRRELCPNCRALLTQNPLALVVDSLCEADRAKLEDVITEPTTEEICEICFSIRSKEARLPKLANEWSKEAKITWLKLDLDFDQLEYTLENLSGKGEISFSVIGEFQEDYSQFLRGFNEQIQHNFRSENVENVLSDFFCIKIGSFKESLRILQIYHGLLENFLPAFLDLEKSPLKIAIVCANPKFPFFEVWKILEGAEEDIFISLQEGRTLRAPIRALRPLIEAANMQYHKSALYKLTRIEETSKALAELVFQNRRDEDSRTYSRLGKALRPGLDFSSIFTFARLMQD